ncbi:MAG: hypothetical protein GQ532_00650 [Methylomarinum sp.]|nr:hypothetical protein [Methylomarinum sp.]
MNDAAVQENIAQLALVVSYLAWPITVLFIIKVFYQPIFNFLNNLSAKIVEVNKIKIGGFEFSASELENAIIEREILKIGIIIGTSDKRVNKEEMNFLETRAISMGGDPKNLSHSAKKRILKQAVLIATADKKTTDEEYEELKRIGLKYDISGDEVDSMVLEYCAELRASLPPVLQNKYKK